ncbi:unnamed protein product [Arctogadus glacialis]
MTTCEPDTHCVSSQPVLMSEPKWDEAAWLEDTAHQKRKLLEARRVIKSQQNRDANCHQQKMEHLLQSVL